ncbi:MAG: PD-(D/E)XK nuclease family protein, partial [Ruminococcus sp.]|nr:PD-(D/E)XK nuclease family protein [Ruminococcus sp.]
AVYPESEACNTKISFIEKSAFEDAEVPELEAAYIAHEIHKMMGEGFTVTDGSVRRRATYGDFAVIMRSPKRRAAAYVHTLINCGIPAYSEEKDNCFDAQEVKILLNLLRVIDNPSVDIPLLSVMCSPIYGFTPDELAELRAQSRYSSLYQAVILYAKKSKKAESFLNQLGSLRAYSCACTVDELIGRVLEATALGAITSSVNGGESPTRNLSLIRAYARSFESGGTKSLSDFISFADRLKENGSALPASQDSKSSINGVRVLSIHKSKGLEFPVCFIAGTAFEFNHSDLRNDVLIDSYAGLGIKRKQGICRYNTLPRIAVELEIKKNEIAEELRVLYVALTRAREKLVIVSSVNNVEKYLSNIYSKLVFERVIEPYAVTKCRSISDWITLAALTNPSLNEYRRACNPSAPMISAKAAHPEWEVEIINAYEDIFTDPESELSDATEEIELGETTEKDYAEILRKNLAFEYRNAEIMDLPQKVSASEIAHGEHIEHFGRLIAKPAFASRELSSAVERGTVHHAFLQYCDFEAAAKDISSEINRLQAENRLSEAQAKAIDTQRLSAMLNTELFSRIIHSDRVYREERFFVKLRPSEVFGECGGADNAGIIVQGAVDLAFEENGGLVILDYKTDRVRDINRLCQLYQRQLGIYKLAMEQSLEIRVNELIIVSVYLNDYISLDFPE